MPRKENKVDEAYFDHYTSVEEQKETATAEELMKYSNKNSTMPIDLSKLNK